MNIQKLDMSLDPGKEKEREQETRKAIRAYQDTFGSLDLKKSYPALFELLWYGHMPCTDVKGLTSKTKDELSFIKRCFWKNKLTSCNAIFQKRPTDQGTCCSFNIEKAENILKDSNYKNAISLRQSEEAKMGFEADEKPEWYLMNNEPSPEVGRDKGLTLVVDGHSDTLSTASVKDNFRGFVTVVDDNDKFPLVSLSSLIARPGFENNIEVSAIHMLANDEIKKYKPIQRHCYFPDEYELEVHQLYSQSNCIFECRALFAFRCLRTCTEFGESCDCKNASLLTDTLANDTDGCVPWFYPAKDERVGKICNPWNTQKFQRILKEQIPKNQCQHCLPDCTTTVYDTSISYAELGKCDHTNIGTSTLCDLIEGLINPPPWINAVQNEYSNANETLPWYLYTNTDKSRRNIKRFPNRRSNMVDTNIEKNLIFRSDQKLNPTYDAFEKDIGIINIFFGKGYILKYRRNHRMSYFDFLSQIGGSIGLAMGISIISFVEIIYWFTFRLLRNIMS